VAHYHLIVHSKHVLILDGHHAFANSAPWPPMLYRLGGTFPLHLLRLQRSDVRLYNQTPLCPDHFLPNHPSVENLSLQPPSLPHSHQSRLQVPPPRYSDKSYSTWLVELRPTLNSLCRSHQKQSRWTTSQLSQSHQLVTLLQYLRSLRSLLASSHIQIA
jgi:hypothetical protein